MRRPHAACNRSNLSPAIPLLVCAVMTITLGGTNEGIAKDPPIVIRGSSTLQPLAEVWADAIRRDSRSIRFDINGTGTSEGIGDLLAGQADIAMASRPLTADEEATALQNGLKLRVTVVARMGIAVVTNVANPVKSMNVDDLARVFSGEIQNWQSVGGPDQPIMVVRKESGWSPDFFRRRIMGEKDFVQDATIVDSKEEVVLQVADRRWSVGVTGMPEAIPALDRVALLRLVSAASEEDATYALSRPLFFFSIEGSASVEHFLDFVTGETAQSMIKETGFYPGVQVDVIDD